jgi:hypothetical protein
VAPVRTGAVGTDKGLLRVVESDGGDGMPAGVCTLSILGRVIGACWHPSASAAAPINQDLKFMLRSQASERSSIRTRPHIRDSHFSDEVKPTKAKSPLNEHDRVRSVVSELTNRRVSSFVGGVWGVRSLCTDFVPSRAHCGAGSAIPMIHAIVQVYHIALVQRPRSKRFNSGRLIPMH